MDKIDNIDSLINKVYNCDCLELLKEIPNESIDTIITDPPYSLNYNFSNDDLSYKEQDIFMKQYCKSFFDVLKKNGTICIFMSQEMSHYLYFNCIENGFIWQNEVIWNRDGGQMPIKKFGICHERIMIFTKGNSHKTFNLDELRVKSKYADSDKRLNPLGKNPGDVWYVSALFGKKIERIKREDGKTAHPTQKPLNIIYPLIMAYSNKNDIIFDGFAGSFTTAVAAESLGRNWICCELLKEYCDVGQKRIGELRASMKDDGV